MSTNSGGAEGGGPGDPKGSHHQAIVESTAAATSTMVGGITGEPKRMRTFQEILAEETENRNILEIKLKRMNVINEAGEQGRAKNLSTEDVSILLFDVIKVKPEDCQGVALYTSRYDTKEIKLKSHVDPTPYLTEIPIQFKDHEVIVIKQTTKVTRIAFKNVPFNVPDEELINLCDCYGKPVNNVVHYNAHSKNTMGVGGSTRYVDCTPQWAGPAV